MLDKKLTVKDGTMTREGFIPHIVKDGIMLPVRLDIKNHSVRDILAYQDPVRKDGELVYVIPGESYAT